MKEQYKQFSVKINDYYSLKGIECPVDNPVAYVVAITGMNEYARRYDRFITRLNKEGYYVFFFDHFGQGENIEDIKDLEKVPHNSWNMELTALYSKVLELKETGKPVYMFGHSMGSFSMQAFLEKYPDVSDKTIIMGTNGKNAKASFVLGNLLSKIITNKKNWDTFDKTMTNMVLVPYSKSIKNRQTDLDWLSYDKDNVERYIRDDLCGAKNTHGFFKEFLSGLSQLYKKKNLKNISKDSRILIISGEDDPVGANSKGPLTLYNLYKNLGVKDVSIKIYPHKRHEVLNEGDGEEATGDIIDFLNRE